MRLAQIYKEYALCDFGFMLQRQGQDEELQGLARANEVQVRAQVGGIGKGSEGAVKLSARETEKRRMEQGGSR